MSILIRRRTPFEVNLHVAAMKTKLKYLKRSNAIAGLEVKDGHEKNRQIMSNNQKESGKTLRCCAFSTLFFPFCFTFVRLFLVLHFNWPNFFMSVFHSQQFNCMRVHFADLSKEERSKKEFYTPQRMMSVTQLKQV